MRVRRQTRCTHCQLCSERVRLEGAKKTDRIPRNCALATRQRDRRRVYIGQRSLLSWKDAAVPRTCTAVSMWSLSGAGGLKRITVLQTSQDMLARAAIHPIVLGMRCVHAQHSISTTSSSIIKPSTPRTQVEFGCRPLFRFARGTGRKNHEAATNRRRRLQLLSRGHAEILPLLLQGKC